MAESLSVAMVVEEPALLGHQSPGLLPISIPSVIMIHHYGGRDGPVMGSGSGVGSWL